MPPDEFRKRIYKKNFVDTVTLKIDYPKISNLEKTEQLEEFHKIIKKLFPSKREIRGISVEGQIDNDDFQISKTQPNLSWEFFNKDESKKLMITQDYISINYSKYKNFDIYFKEIKIVFDAFNRFFSIAIAKQIGLRYINLIKIETGNPLDWRDLINKNLLYMLDFNEDKIDILKNLQYFEQKISDFRMIFWSGVYNSEYPNPLSRREFVLDYDCQINDDVQFSEFYSKIELFNETIDKWFEHSIEDGLRQIMEEVGNAEQ